MFKTIIASTFALGVWIGSAMAQAPVPAPAATDPVDAAAACLIKAGLTFGTEEDARASRVHFTVRVVKTHIGTEERQVAFARGVVDGERKAEIAECMKGFGRR